MTHNFSQTAAFIWSVADLLRGDFRQSQYGRIILPFTVLRRLECVLEPTRDRVLAKYKEVKKRDEETQSKFLKRAAKQWFYNTSKLTLGTLSNTQTLKDIENYVASFGKDGRDIFEHFHFADYLQQLNEANLLYKVVEKFKSIDLSPRAISNHDMGLVFEELIRKFAESSNDTAGEHFTPRDIVRLATSLVFMEDDEALSKPGVVRAIYDPTAGTGGFLSSGTEYVYELNPKAKIAAFGQELNPESFAICKADMLIKGQPIDNIKLGNTLSDDQLYNKDFDYMLSNPPFGVDWKKVEKAVKDEHSLKGYDGRFGPGLPRISDGSLLFLLHLIHKMRSPKDGGSRIGIILNGSPLFTGGAGSGESEIRRYILEADLLEAIVALPTDMFYNTGIATYVWVLCNHKSKERQGKVQLINASNNFGQMRKSLGSKRKYLTEDNIKNITIQFGKFRASKTSKKFKTTDFGYRRITVERPLRLSAQFTDERIKILRYQPNIRELMQWAYEHFGEAVYDNIKQFKEQILAHIKHKEIKLKAAQQKDLLDVRVWKKQQALMEHAYALKGKIGDKQFDDYNSFEPLLKSTLKELDIQLDVKEKKQLIDSITWKNSNAKRVIKKTHTKAKDKKSIYGYFPATENDELIEYQVDTDLRDYENVPLKENIERYFEREVAPHVPDAWIDANKYDEKDGRIGIVGYEIPFNRHFYEYQPPRPLEEIDADLDKISREITELLQEVHV